MATRLSAVTHTDVKGFLGLKGEWNSLLGRSNTDTIFLTWQWQKAWWDIFGQRARPLIVAVRDEGELVGLAPFYTLSPDHTPRTLRLIGGTDVSDYLDIVSVRGREKEVYSALWEFLANEHDYSWQVIDLHNVPGASPTLAMLPVLPRDTEGVHVSMDIEDVCPVITLPSSWEDYLSLLDRKQRHELRRKIRKAETAGTVRWYCVEDVRALHAEVEDFIELHESSSREKKDFMDQRMKEFFQTVAHSMFTEGWLRLSFLLINDVKTAAMLCFEYNNSILLYNSGYDPSMHPSLSTGLVLLAYCIRDAIDKGLTTFDFLRGAEEYKYRLGGQDTNVFHLTIGR